MSVTTKKIEYAVEIDVSNDTRTIVDVDMYGGFIRYISNDVSSLVYEDDTIATGFISGRLADNAISGMSNTIDLSIGGGMSTLNTCKVTIDNNTNASTGDSFISRLLSNAVYLTNSKVTLYVVINGKLYARFSGVVSEMSYNEKYLIVTCKDINEDNFKTIAGGEYSQVAYGDAGYIPIAKSNTELEVYTGYGHTYSYSETNGDVRLTITISRNLYLENYGQANTFTGWYVKPRRTSSVNPNSDFNTAVKVLSNGEPTPVDVGNGRYIYVVDLQIEYTLEDVDSTMMLGANGILPNTTDTDSVILNNTNSGEYLLFDLVKSSIEYKISDNIVSGIKRGASGLPEIYRYSDAKNEYTLYSEASYYNDGIISLNSNIESVDVNNYTEINIESVRLAKIENVYGVVDENDKAIINSVGGTSNFENANSVISGVLENYPVSFAYQHMYYGDGSFNGHRGGVFEITLPDSFNFDDFEEVSFVASMSIRTFSGNENYEDYNGLSSLSLNIKTLIPIQQDVYGYVIENESSTVLKLSNTPITSTKLDLNREWNEKYDDVTDPPYVPTSIAYTLEPDAGDYSPDPEAYISPLQKTLPDGCKQRWGATFIDTYGANNIREVGDTIQSIFSFDSNPVVKTTDGKKKIYLWISGDPNDSSSVFEDQIAQIYVNNIGIICNNKESIEDLYVRTSGEILSSELASFGELVYRDTGITLSSNEWNYIEESASNTWERINVKTTINGIAKNINSLEIGDTITLKKDDTNYSVFEVTNNTILYSSDGIYTISVRRTEALGSIVDGDYCSYLAVVSQKTTSVYGIMRDIIENKNNFYDADYGNLLQERLTWTAGRLINKSTSTKDLLQNLAIQSFVGVCTGRKGNLRLDAFKDYATYEYSEDVEAFVWAWKDGVTYTEYNTNNIVKGSIKNAKSTNLTNIMNNINLNYGYNYSTGLFEKTYYVTNVSGTFPELGDYSDYSNVPERTTAEILWNHASETYSRNGINKSTDKNKKINECYWYNEYSSNVLNSSIHYYLTDLTEWVTKSKNIVTFSIPMNEENITIDLMDRVIFSDVLLTGSTDILGWVTYIKPNIQDATIEISITTVPVDLVPVYQYIDESSTTTDDSIDETPNMNEEIEEQFTI